ncbi:hypothetical protein [Roseobacter sp.]|uniref:hypothetical protein n=1 Tax=Roseobacter sp. TaxID=1907202 RepID=UPI0038585174
MSFQSKFPGLFTPEQGALPIKEPQPVTNKQMRYAQAIALKTGTVVPKAAAANRAALSQWIDTHQPKPIGGKFSNYPSSKQVEFAERIARAKNKTIPNACFRDKIMMSKWIDGNKPR